MKNLDGKYSYSRDDNGVLHLYRNGEKCDNLISNPLISAIYKIEELEEDLNDSNEKLVHVCCQHEKCFNHLKKVVKVLKNVYEPMQPACLEEVEQFIKENE